MTTVASGSSTQSERELQLKEYALAAEFNLVAKTCLSGVYVVPKASTPFEWMGVLFIRHGWYQGGIFRFTLIMPENFPDAIQPPKVVFEDAIFHPQISPDSCELDLKTAFSPWKKGTHHLHQVLSYAQKVFYRLDLEEAVNSRCARLFESNSDEFHRRVRESVRRSREVVYEPPESSDANAIKFSPWDQIEHEKVRSKILGRPAASTKNRSLPVEQPAPPIVDDIPANAQTSGLSWFDASSFAILALERSRCRPSNDAAGREKTT